MTKDVNTYRITQVATQPGYRLHVQYMGGTTVDLDLSELVSKNRAFKPLADPAAFAAAQVGDYGWSIEWGDTVGLDSERIMEMALQQQGRADTLAFRRWQDAHGMSLAEAADAIGMSKRSASQYRTGARPVPKTVLLALKGWEVEHAG